MYIPVLWWEIFFMTFRRDSWGKYYVQYELSSIFCGSVNSWFFCVRSLFGQGSKAVSPLLLSMGLLPPVRCLKSIPRALRAVTLLWARTSAIHALCSQDISSWCCWSSSGCSQGGQGLWGANQGGQGLWGAGGAEVLQKGQEGRDALQGCSARTQPKHRAHHPPVQQHSSKTSGRVCQHTCKSSQREVRINFVFLLFFSIFSFLN